jgi:hypothetical protein
LLLFEDLNTEELRAKRANAERIKEFAKNLQKYNREILQQQRKLPSSSEAIFIALYLFINIYLF